MSETPLADMVRVMLERDASRDEIVTAIEGAERHAANVTRHALRHVTEMNEKTKSAERSRRYREKKARDSVTFASRDAISDPLTKKELDLKEKKERGRASRASRSSRATQIPPDFQPDWKAAAATGLSRSEAEREFLKFKNHAAQNGRTCVNWQAAWSNWCIKAAEFLGKPPPIAGPANGSAPVPIAPAGAPSDEELRKKYGQQNHAIPPKTQASVSNGGGADHTEELRRQGAEIRPGLRAF